MDIRSAFYSDSMMQHNGKTFQIVGLKMEDVGGDHPEPMFIIQFNDGMSLDDVNAECIFEGFDTHFDKWVEENY